MSTAGYQHHLVVITGANRGFGASIARSYISESGVDRLSFVLVGRSKTGLTTVLSGLESSSSSTTATTITVVGKVVDNVDLSDTEKLDENIQRVLNAMEELRKAASIDHYPVTKSVLFNNAGSLGNLSKTAKEYSWQESRKYLDFNVVSFIGLSNAFLNNVLSAHPTSSSSSSSSHSTAIISISSLLAVQAFPYWSLYATGKSARDMFLNVLGKEEKNKQHKVKTLNYAPGPLDNEMQADVRSTLGDAEQLEIYDGMHKKGQLVQMDESSQKLIRILKTDEYESGAHIDFYDK